jgi:hypothetical protein
MSLLVVLLALAGGGENEWEIVSEADGITIWMREIGDTGLREARAELEVAAPAKVLWDVLADVPKLHEFIPWLEEARLVAEEGERVKFVYQRVSPPLVADRDYTLRLNLTPDPERGVYEHSWSVNVCEGAWTLKVIDENRTRLTYAMRTDPGGGLPTFLANMSTKRSLPWVLKAVRKRAEDYVAAYATR